jgi:hypothetical protein
LSNERKRFEEKEAMKKKMLIDLQSFREIWEMMVPAVTVILNVIYTHPFLKNDSVKRASVVQVFIESVLDEMPIPDQMKLGMLDIIKNNLLNKNLKKSKVIMRMMAEASSKDNKKKSTYVV